MNRKFVGAVSKVVVALMLSAPVAALAAPREPDKEPVDARLEGYPTNVTLDSSSTGLTWVLLIVCGGLVFGGLFKDAKRSHLD